MKASLKLEDFWVRFFSISLRPISEVYVIFINRANLQPLGGTLYFIGCPLDFPDLQLKIEFLICY